MNSGLTFNKPTLYLLDYGDLLTIIGGPNLLKRNIISKVVMLYAWPISIKTIRGKSKEETVLCVSPKRGYKDKWFQNYIR